VIHANEGAIGIESCPRDELGDAAPIFRDIIASHLDHRSHRPWYFKLASLAARPVYLAIPVGQQELAQHACFATERERSLAGIDDRPSVIDLGLKAGIRVWLRNVGAEFQKRFGGLTVFEFYEKVNQQPAHFVRARRPRRRYLKLCRQRSSGRIDNSQSVRFPQRTSLERNSECNGLTAGVLLQTIRHIKEDCHALCRGGDSIHQGHSRTHSQQQNDVMPHSHDITLPDA